MAALQTSQAPMLIRLANGQLVPVSGGALVDPTAPAPAAAMMDDTGALTAHPMAAAGDSGALPPAAAQVAQIIDMAKHRGGAATGGAQAARLPSGGLPLPQQPPVLEAPQGSQDDGSAGIGALMKALGKNAGSGGGVGEANGGGDFIGTSSDTSSQPGFLDRMKSFLGIGDKPAGPAPSAAAPTADPVSTALAAAHPGLITDPATGQMSQPAPQPMAQDGALVDAPVPTPRPDLPTDVVPQQVQQTDIAAAAQPQNISAGTPALPQEEPGYFERLKSNPMALALLTGGLRTMVAASRPGATALGSIGEGALGGINTVFEEDASQKAEALKAQRETSEAKLREKQGEFYGTKGTALTENADTNRDYKGALVPVAKEKAAAATSNANSNAIKAGAASKTADARMIAAQRAAAGVAKPTALIQNAQWLVDNKIAADLPSAVTTLRSAARNPGQRASLVTARAKLYLSSSIAPTEADVASAKKRAERDVDSDLSAAAPASGGGALGGAAQVNSAADVERLPTGALYINPADGKTYKKK